MENTREPLNKNQLRAAARIVGQMLSQVGDFYDVAEEIANGYALGTLHGVEPQHNPAYTGPRQIRGELAEGVEPNSGAAQDTAAPPSKEYLRQCLIALNELRSVSANVIPWRVDDAKNSGMLWSEIGDALEITKQAAQQRYGGTVRKSFT